MSSSIEPMEIAQYDVGIPETTGGRQDVSEEQIRATIYGECIGDAVGNLAKHMTRDEVKKTFLGRPLLEYDTIDVNTKTAWKAGDWTDNSDQMILMMHSLIDNGGQIKPQDFASKLVKWLHLGFKELGDTCGMVDDRTIEQIVQQTQFTQQPHMIAEKIWQANKKPGTKSCLMRTSILGIHEWSHTEQVVKNVISICKTTHWDSRCHATAISIAVAISLMLQHHPNIYKKGKLNVDALAEEVYCYAADILPEDERKSLRFYLQCKDLPEMSLLLEKDDVFKCLGAGFWALRQQDFQKALVAVISSGGDAHTNGAVAGALLGCKLGNKTLFPTPWTRLVHNEWLGGIIERFLAMLERYKSPQPQSLDIVTDTDIRTEEQQKYPRKFKHLSPDVTQQIVATLYGQCIGDAIGLLTEFMTEGEAMQCYPRKDKLEYKSKVRDGHRSRWEVGDWTDDSDQMFLIMLSLTEHEGKVMPIDFATRMVRWMNYGFKELGDTGGLGIGQTTYSILSDPMFIKDPYQVAKKVWERSHRHVAPNGGVMRTSILGVHDWWDTDQVKTNAVEICQTTHVDPRCQASAVAVSVAISLMLQKKFYKNGSYDVEELINVSYKYASECLVTTEQHTELKKFMKCTKLDDLKLDEQDAIGYTYKCMGAGFWALKQTDFRKAITDIAMKGGDADTNGAVAGALLGCKLGNINVFPESWLNLRHRHWLDQNIDSFLKVMDKRYPTRE